MTVWYFDYFNALCYFSDAHCFYFYFPLYLMVFVCHEVHAISVQWDVVWLDLGSCSA